MIAKFDGTKTGIGRALLVDSGVTKKNVAINIATFAAAVQFAIKTLNEQVVAGIGQSQFLRAGTPPDARFRPSFCRRATPPGSSPPSTRLMRPA